MRPQPLYEVLSGQRLTSVHVHDPWGEEPSWECMQAQWPLFGALALTFERHTLLVGSPLRSMRSQEGTRYGLADGSSVSLGFRALLCDAEQAEALVQLRFGLPQTALWWDWLPSSVEAIDQRLRAAPWLSLSPSSKTAAIMLDFEEGQRYRLEYRLDLDGAIAFSPEGSRCEPDGVEVLRPKGPFGWLHPASIAGFVLDDQRWRNTEHWPIEIRRRLRDADPEGPEVRHLLKRAWRAYLYQHPPMLQRLLALQIPVRVAGLPDGFVEAVRAELLAEHPSKVTP